MSAENSALLWLPALAGLAVKSLLVFLIAGAALLALRRASASARHLVCLLTLAGLLALPLLSVALPGWRLAVLAAGPTPALRATPPETGGGGVVVGGKAGMTNSAPPSPSFPASSPLRFGEGGGGRAGRGSAQVTPAPRPFPWLPLLLSLWSAGALLSLGRPLLGLWGIGRLSQASEPVLDAPALALADECAAALGLARTPTLRQAGAPVPMTWGWRRPVVLLPDGARDWTEGRLRAVLLHELAHVRRRDWLSHRMADAVCALYWFHPLVWLTARRLRAEGEIACDDLVLTAGVAAPDYARHLLDVARALRPAQAETVPQAAVAMARTARIEGRLTMILDNTRPRRALTRRALLLVLGAGAVALVPLAMLRPDARADAPGVVPLQYRHSELPHGMPAAPVIGASDTTVQLAGIADSDAQDWWDANGAALAHPLYHYNSPHSTGLRDARQRRVLLAFRLPLAAQDVTVKYSLTGCLFSSSGGTWQSKTQSTNRQDEAQISAKTNGTRDIYAVFPASVSRTNVHVGVASGPWKVIAAARRSASGQIEGLSVQRDNAGYIFSPVAETKQGTMLTISVNTANALLSPVTFHQNEQTGRTSFHIWPAPAHAADDLRIIAVDAQGREVLPSDIGDRSIEALDQITARFALAPAQIKEIRLESRPFHYVEFKDVAVRPAK